MKLVNSLLAEGRARGCEIGELLSGKRWAFILVAAILSVGVAELAYLQLDLPQKYSEFVVGAVAWDYTNKFHDYAVLYVLAVAFAILLAVVARIVARMKRVFNEAGVKGLECVLVLCCLPAGLWLGQLVISRGTSLLLLHVSQILLLFALLFAVAMAHRGAHFWQEDPGFLFRTHSTFMLFLVVLGLIVPALGVAVNRLGGRVHTSWFISGEAVSTWTLILLACGAGFALWTCSTAKDSKCLELRSRQFVMAGQWLMPLFMLCLVPPSWVWPPSTLLGSGYRMSVLGYLVVIGVLAWTYLGLYRRARIVMRADKQLSSPLELLALGCVVAVLLFLKMPPIGLAYVYADDYHFGEALVPWWSWMNQGMLPFWDYAPARGMVNYIPGALAQLLFKGDPAAFPSVNAFIFVPLIGIVLLVLRRSIGTGCAIIACLLGPTVNGLGEIDLVVTAFLAYLCWGYLYWTPERWFTNYAALGTLLLLYAPGQGALTIVACAPIALSHMKGILPLKGRLPVRLMLCLAALVLLCLLTPLGKMLLGAVRYGIEQSSINSIAHGVSWAASFDTATANAWVFEAMRTLWLVVAAMAAALLLKAWTGAPGMDRTKVLVYASAILVVLLLFVVRAAGRIDAGPSRLGLATSWAVLLLAPLLLFVVPGAREKPALAWVTVAGLITPFLGGMALGTLADNYRPLNAQAYDRTSIVRVSSDARLGTGFVDRAQLVRVAATRRVLDTVLEPHETYLDMTTRHAMYYYVNRRPPVESGAMYNLVGEAQQLRAIRSLRKIKPPAVLLESENMTHDGGPSSLRSNLVYRDVLLARAYKLVVVGSQTWLIREDRVPRVVAWPDVKVLEVDASVASPLMTIFHARDLKSIPASWGRSFKTLQDSVDKVLDIQPSAVVAAHDLLIKGAGRYVVDGTDPFVRFDVSAANLGGKDAGLLSFDFRCYTSPTAQPRLSVFWSSDYQTETNEAMFELAGHQGRLLVPVDSSPSWLLSPHIRTVRIDLESQLDACKEFSIHSIQLWRRKAVSLAAQ